MKLEQIKALDKKHIAQTFSRYELAFSKAKGAHVWDSQGRKYLDLLGGVAQRKNATPAQVALAWLQHRSTAMLPIPGTSSVSHLEENVAAGSLQLDEAEWREIERSSG